MRCGDCSQTLHLLRDTRKKRLKMKTPAGSGLRVVYLHLYSANYLSTSVIFVKHYFQLFLGGSRSARVSIFPTATGMHLA
jgi:hypothetical protein